MEPKLNFNSQICTTREQSERLLALGLKKETADMVYYRESSIHNWGILAKPWRDDFEGSKWYYPAWSLGRLIEIKVMKTSSQILLPLDNTFDGLIEDIETRIKGGYFNKEYLV